MAMPPDQLLGLFADLYDLADEINGVDEELSGRDRGRYLFHRTDPAGHCGVGHHELQLGPAFLLYHLARVAVSAIVAITVFSVFV